MEVKRVLICRFCLMPCRSSFKNIEEMYHKTLNMLLPTLNLSLSKDPIVCEECSQQMQKYLTFKTISMDMNYHQNIKAMCLFCKSVTLDKTFVCLNSLDTDVCLLRSAMVHHFPELGIQVNAEVIICSKCCRTLKCIFHFLAEWQIVEQRIEEYCQVIGSFGGEGINLKDVIRYTQRKVVGSKVILITSNIELKADQSIKQEPEDIADCYVEENENITTLDMPTDVSNKNGELVDQMFRLEHEVMDTDDTKIDIHDENLKVEQTWMEEDLGMKSGSYDDETDFPSSGDHVRDSIERVVRKGTNYKSVGDQTETEDLQEKENPEEHKETQGFKESETEIKAKNEEGFKESETEIKAENEDSIDEILDPPYADKDYSEDDHEGVDNLHIVNSQTSGGANTSVENFTTEETAFWIPGDLKEAEREFPKPTYDDLDLSVVKLFELFLDNEIVQDIAMQTSLNARFHDVPFLNVTKNEVKCFIAILVLSGYNPLPNSTLFWDRESDMRNDLVWTSMTKNRFFAIMRYLHFSDDNFANGTDKIQKVAPLIHKIKRNCIKHFRVEENVIYDKITVKHLKRRHSKGLGNGKTACDGCKIHCLTSTSGYLVNFDLCESNDSAPFRKMLDEMPDAKKRLPYTFYFNNSFAYFNNANISEYLKANGYEGTTLGPRRDGTGSFAENISRYRIGIEGKEWWFRIFTWTVDVCIENAWQLHIRAGGKHTQLNFRREIVNDYLKSYGSLPKCNSYKYDRVQYDRLDHLIVLYPGKIRKRCVAQACLAKVRTMCKKCQVRLCVDCFATFHTK